MRRRSPLAARRSLRHAPPSQSARTLAVDVGGSHIKASVLNARGKMLHERVRVDTPKGLTPAKLVSLIAGLVEELPPFDRVSVGFPGVVRDGVIRTAENLGNERFRGFDLAAALERRLGRPVRVENDADVQGLAVVSGRGIEMVVTLGTGFGTSLFSDGKLCPHLELAHHPFRGAKTYEEELGESARERHGNKYWKRRLVEAIETLDHLVNFDHMYIGGGNARLLDEKLPPRVSIVPNVAGIIGGVKLWDHGSRRARRAQRSR